MLCTLNFSSSSVTLFSSSDNLDDCEAFYAAAEATFDSSEWIGNVDWAGINVC